MTTPPLWEKNDLVHNTVVIVEIPVALWLKAATSRFYPPTVKKNLVYDFLYSNKEWRTAEGEICASSGRREDGNSKLRDPVSRHMYICGTHSITGEWMMVRRLLQRLKVVHVGALMRQNRNIPGNPSLMFACYSRITPANRMEFWAGFVMALQTTCVLNLPKAVCSMLLALCCMFASSIRDHNALFISVV